MNVIGLGLGQSASQFLGLGFSPGEPAPGASAAEIWAYTLSNGLTAGQNVVAIYTMLNELHLIHGLKLGSPLTVTPTTRVAGAVEQAIEQSGNDVTVTRQ